MDTSLISITKSTFISMYRHTNTCRQSFLISWEDERIIDAYILLHNKWHLKCTSTFPSAVWRASDGAKYGLVGRHNQNKGISWLPSAPNIYDKVWENIPTYIFLLLAKIFNFFRTDCIAYYSQICGETEKFKTIGCVALKCKKILHFEV